MTETPTQTDDRPTTRVEVDDEGQPSLYAFDETPLATTQAAHLTEVLTWTKDERQGLWGQPLP